MDPESCLQKGGSMELMEPPLDPPLLFFDPEADITMWWKGTVLTLVPGTQSEFKVVCDDELDQQHQFLLLEDLKSGDLRILE